MEAGGGAVPSTVPRIQDAKDNYKLIVFMIMIPQGAIRKSSKRNLVGKVGFLDVFSSS